MKIIIIPSMMYPLPPVKGGAVQNLIKQYICYNEKQEKNEIHVFSFFDYEAKKESTFYKYTKFHYINETKILDYITKKRKGRIRSISLLFKKKIYLTKILLIIKKIIKQTDLLLLENTPEYAPFFKHKFPNTKIYCHLHNDYLKEPTPNNKEIVKSIDHFICVSNYIGNQIKELYKKNEITIVYNGIDSIKPNLEKIKIIQKMYKTSYNNILLLYAGRLVPEKGIDILLEAFSNIKNKNKCSLIIVGGNAIKNIKDEYIEKITTSYTNNNIHFVGYIPYEEVVNYYYASDIGIVPSLCEDACPLSIIECILYGVPIITTESGGIPELVNDKCSIMIKRDNKLITSLSNSIDFLIENKEQRITMNKEALKRGRRYSSDLYAKKLNQVLKNSQKRNITE